jgi:CO/xanthine dehydrogenase Mo-binding subunit
MDDLRVIGQPVPRKDAALKVTGAARYTDDLRGARELEAALVISPYAHARILGIDTAAARRMPGVRAIVTGADWPHVLGDPMADRPPLAFGKVRYHGEPVAVVVADQLHQAMAAANQVRVEYRPLPVVNSPRAALAPGAPLVHEDLGTYEHARETHPVPGTNIATLIKIRKGDMARGWAASEVVVEAAVAFPQADHCAMEDRCATAEIRPDGQVVICSCSQAPFIIREWIGRFFHIPAEDVTVHTPLVGGAFGGKAPIQLELIAYLASRAAGGQRVKLLNTREQDFLTSPVHIGLDARVKLGATREGRLVAAELEFLFDGGAYSDRGVIIARAAAQDCTGPYGVAHVHCDSYCLYTNHPWAAPFRGFGHPEMTFAVERAMDLLADRLGLDPLRLREINAAGPGDTSPTQAPLTASNLGDLPQCIAKLKELVGWEEEPRVLRVGPKIRARGVACFWKNSSSPVDAGAGAVLTFAEDGGAILVGGAVELGTGTKTVLAQMVAERLRMDVDRVRVVLPVDTATTPHHWKTVASRSTLLVGRAAVAAADDALAQLQAGVKPELVVGRGSYQMQGLTELDPETGAGMPGPEWGVGAQMVEVEYDPRDFTYRLLRAATVVDAGVVLNPITARGQITGGMSMGLSWARGEGFAYAPDGTVIGPQFRTYHLHRFGDQPEYLVGFVETPNKEGPYGLRGMGEHGVIGMAGALANSLSLACGAPLGRLPLTPEEIWRATGGRP